MLIVSEELDQSGICFAYKPEKALNTRVKAHEIEIVMSSNLEIFEMLRFAFGIGLKALAGVRLLLV
jgi:hypothetical protein